MGQCCKRVLQGLFAVMVCMLLFSMSGAPAYAAGDGWIEVRSKVPDDLNSYLILSIVNEDTQEDFDIAVLPDNDFYAREQVPQGTYSVAAAWVFQDYRYMVIAEPQTFKVGKDAAAPINLTVTLPEGEKESESEAEKILEVDLDEEEIFADLTKDRDETEAPAEDYVSDEESASEMEEPAEATESEMSTLTRVLILVLGVLIFAGVAAGVVLFIRRYY